MVRRHGWRGMASAIGLGAACAAGWGAPAIAQGVSEPLVLERSMPIPNVPVGAYSDVLSLDVKGGRVFATPQAAKMIAVLDLKDGHLIRTIPGFTTLQGVYYHERTGRLFAVDSATGDLKVFDGATYAPVTTIRLAHGADVISFDKATGLLYVSNGGEDAGMDHALISVVDPVRLEKLADIPVDAAALEFMVIDPQRQLLYVNLVDGNAVAVVGLKARRVIGHWPLPPGDHFPFSLALDTGRHRLYVVSRDGMNGLASRGTMFALDTADGRVMATIPIGGWADGVLLDRKRGRLYVTTGVGWIDTFRIEPHDVYRKLPEVESSLVAKHGLFSEELDRLFVDAPHMSRAGAQVLVYKPRP